MDPSKLTAYRDAAAAAAARADKATPGPWFRDSCEMCTGVSKGTCAADREFFIADDTTYANAEFIAAARDDIPTLATAVDELCAEVERLQCEYARGRADERAAVVAWLSSGKSECRNIDYDAIERGEHVEGKDGR